MKKNYEFKKPEFVDTMFLRDYTDSELVDLLAKYQGIEKAALDWIATTDSDDILCWGNRVISELGIARTNVERINHEKEARRYR